MSKEAQSSIDRVIVAPGYHISPKYDLEGFRKRVDQNDEKEYDVVLPLTSMIDMFSMLVIFLLLNFSATGEAYFVNKDIKLPEAMNAQAIESMPLVSIVGNTVSLDSAVVGSNPITVKSNNESMPALARELKRLKGLIQNQKAAGIPTKDGINFQADQTTDVVYIKRVMTVLITEGFSKINFVVRPGEE